ncbi:MAG TPA: ribonuclease HII [Coriobacteriia bacterium]|jgi:ribonuclease HII
MGERPSIEEVRALLSSASMTHLPRVIARFKDDERKGVADAIAAARRRLKRYRAEDRRLLALYELQAELHEQGLVVIAGVDEVGRGALAGPLTAAAVILPVDAIVPGLNDSKLLTPEKREEVAVVVRELSEAWAVAHVEAEEIDHFGMTQANRLAMRRALDALGVQLDHALVDGIDGHLGLPCTTVVDGDAKVACIAAASVVAKVTRDAIMVELDAVYAGYGLAQNKGYSTHEHLIAVRTLGPSAIHRRSFTPCNDDPKLF